MAGPWEDFRTEKKPWEEFAAPAATKPWEDFAPQTPQPPSVQTAAPPSAEQPRAGILETASLIGGQLVDAALYHLPAAIGAAWEGPDPYAERNFADTLVERGRKQARVAAQEGGKGPTAIPGIGREDVAGLGPSLGASIPSMVGGVAAGLGTAAATTPFTSPVGGTVAGWTAGTTASGAIAYRTATNQFVRDLRDAADREQQSHGWGPVSDEEFAQKSAALAPLIREYGLWEAVPEAVGNALSLGIITAPVKAGVGKIFGQNVATRLLTKGAALYGGELATETVTQQGQHNVGVEAGKEAGPARSWTSPGDLATSLREVAPLTVLQTTLLAGGAKAAGLGGGRVAPNVAPTAEEIAATYASTGTAPAVATTPVQPTVPPVASPPTVPPTAPTPEVHPLGPPVGYSEDELFPPEQSMGYPNYRPAQQPTQTAASQSIETSPVFYSKLLKVADEKLPESGAAEQILATLRNQAGVKEEEIEATGLVEFIAGQGGRVSKGDVLAHLEESQVQVQEVIKEYPVSTAKPSWTWVEGQQGFVEYTTPGPKGTYRELLLKMPGRDDILTGVDREYAELQREFDAGAVGTPRGREIVNRLQELNKKYSGQLRKDDFTGSHWKEPNVLAHIRFTERSSAAGKPVLHIEEIQSDWHQTGRTKGYRNVNPASFQNPEFLGKGPDGRLVWRFDVEGRSKMAYGESEEFARKQLADVMNKSGVRVPDAPFKTSWHELAFKRMIRYAADNGYSRISWNNGDLAATYAAGDPRDRKIRGGLAKFYDEIIPSVARKWAKKIGGTMGRTKIEVSVVDRPSATDPIVDVTDWYASEEERRQGERYFTIRRSDGHEFGIYSSREAAEAGRLLWMNNGTQEVNYIDVPEAARTYIQQGFPLFKLEPEVVLNEVIGTPQGVDPAMLDAGKKVAKVLGEFAKRFNLNTKLTIQLTDWSHSGTEQGWAVRGHGKYAINLNLNKARSVAHLYSTAMHEFGHVVFWEHYVHLPDETKQSILAAYSRWLEEGFKTPSFQAFLERRQSAVELYHQKPDSLPRMRSFTIMDLKEDQRAYWAGFEEWIAENTARWATTATVPVGIVEQTFKRMGEVLRQVFELITRRLGLEFRAEPVLAEWLESFLDTAPPVATNIYAALEAQFQRENQIALDSEAKDVPAVTRQAETLGPRVALSQVFDGVTPVPVQAMAAHADRFNWFYKYMAGLSQLIDANPLFGPLLRYGERIRQMHSDESRLQDAALRIGKDWRRLGAQGENLTGLIHDLVHMNYLTAAEVQSGVERQPTEAEFNKLVAQHKLSGEALKVFRKVNTLFLGEGTKPGFVDITAQAAIEAAQRRISDPMRLAARISEIQARVADMKKRPYFPFMRFGRHFVLIKNKAGDIIHYETFERRGFRSAEGRQLSYFKTQKEAAAKRGLGEEVTHGVLAEAATPFIGLPDTLMQVLQDDPENFTPEQLDAFRAMQRQSSPALGFRRDTPQTYIPGYSMDFKRAFARYFFYGAKYYARSRYAWALREDIAQAQMAGGNKAGRIADYMRDHLQNTVLDAKGDFGIFKGAIFFWAMGYVPAAAFQNLSQTPMVTFPFLWAKFGSVKATRAIVGAMTDIKNFYKRGSYEGMTEFEMKALSYGIKTGRISETQAPELAGMSQGANLFYGIGGNKFERASTLIQEKGAWMFEMAEQFNRRIAYRAGLRLGTENPNAKVVKEAMAKYADEYAGLVSEFGEARAKGIITAVHTTDQTQYIYARYARGRFMRGRLPGTLFVFKMYMQSTLMMLGHNKVDVLPRYLLVAGLIGGLAAFPGWDDLKELFKGVARWRFGKEFDIDREIRQYVLQYTDGRVPADMVLHGFARRGFGVPALLDMMGSFFTGKPGRGFGPNENVALAKDDPKRYGHSVNFPFPVVDMSRAISMGTVLPLEVGKLIGPAKDVNSTIAEQTQKASGAVFSVGFNIYKAIMDNHLAVDDPKRWERAVPRLLGSASKMFRSFAEERERSGSRGPNASPTIVSYDTRDTEHLMELLALGAGFQTLRVQEQWDRIIATAEVTKFYDLRRQGLLEQLFEARKGGVKKEIEAVIEEIKSYNQSLHGTPFALKGITSDSLQRSMQSRQRELNARESGTPVRREDIPIARHIQELFPESVVDVRRAR